MASVVGSPRHWSCTTLNDGVDALLDASNNNDAESFYTHTGETTRFPRQLHHFHDFPSFGKITIFRNPGFSFETPSFLRGPTFSWDPEASGSRISLKCIFFVTKTVLIDIMHTVWLFNNSPWKITMLLRTVNHLFRLGLWKIPWLC